MSLTLPVAPAARRLREAVVAWPALLPALVFLPMLVAPPVNHDVAAVLSFSERWLAGERLYVDMIDINPPLIFLLNLVPAAIARASGLGGIAVLQVCLVVLGFALWRLAQVVRDRRREGPVERVLLDVLPGLVVFGAGYDFGQRDTLMAAMAFPYLLAGARRMGGQVPRLGVLAASVAAIGFALKPHFLAVPALVEAAVLAAAVRRGQGLRAMRDSAPWTMVALWLAYIVSLPVAFPDYLDAVVPQALRYYLHNGGQTPWGLLTLPRLGTVVVFLLPLVALAWWRDGALPRVLALAGLGALASTLAQHKGWSYHIMPIELFTCSLAAVLAARWLDRLRVGVAPRMAIRMAAGLVSLFALYLVGQGDAPWNQLRWRQSDGYALSRTLGDAAPDGRVLVLSPGIAPIYPALNYAGAHMTLRSMNLWLLEGAYLSCLEGGKRYRDVWEMGTAEAFLYRTVAEDFARAPPQAVVIDNMTAIPQCGGEAFGLVAYFARHTLFASTWARYAEVAQHGRYSVYVRRD